MSSAQLGKYFSDTQADPQLADDDSKATPTTRPARRVPTPNIPMRDRSYAA
jgi:hypothetical protein